MSETLWDVERLTEATRQSVPMAAQTRVEVVEAERGGSCCACPRRQRQPHRHDVRRRSLRSEFPGGTLFSTTFDASRYYPIVKGVDISFRKFAGTDITVEATMSDEDATAIAAAADEHGKADYDLVMELKDTDGNVVAISTNRYQMRSHGT